MTDGVNITPGSGATVGSDEVTGLTPTLSGSSQVQYIKLVDGTVDSIYKAVVDSTGALKVNVSSIPGASRQTDSTSTALATDTLMNNLIPLTPKFVVISASTVGDSTLISAVSTKQIRVLSFSLVSVGAVSVKFRSATTDITGAMSFAANGGISVPFSPLGHFQTAISTLLAINLSAAVAVGGSLVYVEV